MPTIKIFLLTIFFIVGIFAISSKEAKADTIYTQTDYAVPPLYDYTDWPFPVNNSTGYYHYTLNQSLATTEFLATVTLKISISPINAPGLCWNDYTTGIFYLSAYDGSDNLLGTSNNSITLNDADCETYTDLSFDFNGKDIQANQISYFAFDGGSARSYLQVHGATGETVSGNVPIDFLAYMIIDDANSSPAPDELPDFDLGDPSTYMSQEPDYFYVSMVKPREFRSETGNSFYWVTSTSTFRTYWGINTQRSTSSLSDFDFQVYDKNGNGTSTQLYSILNYNATTTNNHFKYNFYYDFNTTDFAFASTSKYTVIITDLTTGKYYYYKTLYFVTEENCLYCGTEQDDGSSPQSVGAVNTDLIFDYDSRWINLVENKVPFSYFFDIYNTIASTTLVTTTTVPFGDIENSSTSLMLIKIPLATSISAENDFTNPFVTLFRPIMKYALYLGWLMMIFKVSYLALTFQINKAVDEINASNAEKDPKSFTTNKTY